MPSDQTGDDPGAKSDEAPSVIALDDLLKHQAIVASGGEAKHLIQNGGVRVNGVVETRRRRKLRPGDVVEVGDTRLEISSRD